MAAVSRPVPPGALGRFATFMAVFAAGARAFGQTGGVPAAWPAAPADSLRTLADSLAAADRLAAAPESVGWAGLLPALGALALLVLLFHRRSS